MASRANSCPRRRWPCFRARSIKTWARIVPQPHQKFPLGLAAKPITSCLGLDQGLLYNVRRIQDRPQSGIELEPCQQVEIVAVLFQGSIQPMGLIVTRHHTLHFIRTDDRPRARQLGLSFSGVMHVEYVCAQSR